MHRRSIGRRTIAVPILFAYLLSLNAAPPRAFADEDQVWKGTVSFHWKTTATDTTAGCCVRGMTWPILQVRCENLIGHPRAGRFRWTVRLRTRLARGECVCARRARLGCRSASHCLGGGGPGCRCPGVLCGRADRVGDRRAVANEPVTQGRRAGPGDGDKLRRPGVGYWYHHDRVRVSRRVHVGRRTSRGGDRPEFGLARAG
jgi:hypothetical protein